MTDQTDRYDRFKALHDGPGAVVMPNPWDAGSARLLAVSGFDALATTSAGYAFSTGRPDLASILTRDEVLANAAQIVAATDLPVSADLQNGFGHGPGDCADCIRAAAATGLVGGSIEDASSDPGNPIYDLQHATDRIRAAAAAARDLPFLLTARAENYLWGKPDLADTIARLQAYSEAGVRRISVGGSLFRVALGALYRAAEEMMTEGTFTYAADAIPDKRLMEIMAAP